MTAMDECRKNKEPPAVEAAEATVDEQRALPSLADMLEAMPPLSDRGGGDATPRIARFAEAVDLEFVRADADLNTVADCMETGNDFDFDAQSPNNLDVLARERLARVSERLATLNHAVVRFLGLACFGNDRMHELDDRELAALRSLRKTCVGEFPRDILGAALTLLSEQDDAFGIVRRFRTRDSGESQITGDGGGETTNEPAGPGDPVVLVLRRADGAGEEFATEPFVVPGANPTFMRVFVEQLAGALGRTRIEIAGVAQRMSTREGGGKVPSGIAEAADRCEASGNGDPVTVGEQPGDSANDEPDTDGSGGGVAVWLSASSEGSLGKANGDNLTTPDFMLNVADLPALEDDLDRLAVKYARRFTEDLEKCVALHGNRTTRKRWPRSCRSWAGVTPI